MKLFPRPSSAPRKIPLWAWHLNEWLDNGRKGERPPNAPHRTPLWFWKWRKWDLWRARHAHKRHIKKHKPQKTLRPKIVHHARWGATAKNSPQIHYTEDSRRDDWLIAKDPQMLPQWTDCSGWDTQCNYAAGAPDPNGLNYRFLGYTGTILSTAEESGKIYTVINGDASKAKPGDDIVIGPGTGLHTVKVVKEGKDPTVSTHGGEGVQIQLLSVDTREPKRICQILP